MRRFDDTIHEVFDRDRFSLYHHLLRSEICLLSNNALVHFVHDFTLLLLHQVFDITVKLRYLLFNEHLVFREVELVDVGEGFAKHVRLIVRHNVELIS